MLLNTSEASNQESYAVLISKAENLILQQDRVKASHLIQQGIQSQFIKQNEKNKLKKSLHKLTKVFFTEKAQKIFEQAKSFAFKDDTIAQKKFAEALMQEPNNVQILLFYAKYLISLEQSSLGVSLLEKATAMDPYDAGIKYALVVALLSDGQGKEGQSILLDLPRWEKEAGMELFISLMALDRDSLIDEKLQKISLAALQKESGNPEKYYWLWKNQIKSKELGLQNGKKYISICKSITPEMRKKYIGTPGLCSELNLVEAYVIKHLERETEK